MITKIYIYIIEFHKIFMVCRIIRENWNIWCKFRLVVMDEKIVMVVMVDVKKFGALVYF